MSHSFGVFVLRRMTTSDFPGVIAEGAMDKYLRYILYATGGIVLLIFALTFFWWFTHKPYTAEPFVAPMQYVVMVGITGSGAVYYADIDTPMRPKWVLSTLTGVGDIAGSYGVLYTVPSSSGGGVPRYGAYDSGTQRSMPGGTVTKLTADDNGSVGGLGGTSFLSSSINTTSLASTNRTLSSVSMSGGVGYGVGTDGRLYYSTNPVPSLQGGGNASTWTVTQDGTTWTQVSLDGGVVCALKTDGTLWCADRNISSTSANFQQQGTQTFASICLKGGRLIGVDSGGVLRYSATYKSPSWTTVSTQPYNTTTGATTGSPVTFRKVIMIYPSANARRRRLLGTATACNANEEKIGTFCYQECPSGKPAIGTQCPYLAKRTPAIATCPLDMTAWAPTGARTEFIKNSCYQACPPPNTVDPTNRAMCQGSTSEKPTKPLNTNITPASYSCGDGSVVARYIRVRPSPLIANNKLCIKGLSVGLGTGVGSTTTPRYSAKATDGTCADAPIGGTSCGSGAKYLCDNTYDADSDGGQVNRKNKLYWELDLGGVQNIKTIQFTGCPYILQDGTESSAPVGSPNADQITGMIIELYVENKPGTEPVASRTLGPEISQTITFDYVIKDPLMPNRCFDACPKINGVQSIDVGNNACLASKSGVTNRAVSSPVELGKPVCGVRKNANGVVIPYSVTSASDGAAINIENFVPDPSDPEYILSCDNLKDSQLRQQTTYYTGPDLTSSVLARGSPSPVDLQQFFLGAWTSIGRTDSTSNVYPISWNKDVNTPYPANPETPYLCVVPPTRCPPRTVGNEPMVPFKYYDDMNLCMIDELYRSERILLEEQVSKGAFQAACWRGGNYNQGVCSQGYATFSSNTSIYSLYTGYIRGYTNHIVDVSMHVDDPNNIDV